MQPLLHSLEYPQLTLGRLPPMDTTSGLRLRVVVVCRHHVHSSFTSMTSWRAYLHTVQCDCRTLYCSGCFCGNICEQSLRMRCPGVVCQQGDWKLSWGAIAKGKEYGYIPDVDYPHSACTALLPPAGDRNHKKRNSSSGVVSEELPWGQVGDDDLDVVDTWSKTEMLPAAPPTPPPFPRPGSCKSKEHPCLFNIVSKRAPLLLSPDPQGSLSTLPDTLFCSCHSLCLSWTNVMGRAVVHGQHCDVSRRRIRWNQPTRLLLILRLLQGCNKSWRDTPPNATQAV